MRIGVPGPRCPFSLAQRPGGSPAASGAASCHCSEASGTLTIQTLEYKQSHQYLKSDSDSRVCKQAISMKETQALQTKNFQKDVKYRKQKIRHLQAQAAIKEKKNAALDKQVQDMHVTVSQMRNIYEASATEENEALNTEQRYQEVLLVQRLKDTARFQMEKLAFLSAEAQHLRMRNVPSLVQIKYN